MIGKSKFLEEEIPYEKLEKIGITRKGVLSMPKEIIEPLVNGQVTPLIMTRYKADNGKVIEMPMKLQLERGEKGDVRLMTYQVRKDIERENPRLSDKEKQKYIQLDQETKSLILKDAAAVRITEKLREMEKIKDIGLGENQKQAAIEGKPIELTVGDQKVTVGVDLREPQGFKVVNGDMQEWERQMKIRYDNEHEGFMGYVQTDENRWEYQKVVDRLSSKEETSVSQKKEEKKSSGLKL